MGDIDNERVGEGRLRHSRERHWAVIPVAASTVAELESATDELAAALKSGAFGASHGSSYQKRAPGSFTRAFVVDDAARAARVIGGRHQAFQVDGRSAPSAGAVAFMFPGVGEQYVGMGERLYRCEPQFREHFDDCARRLKALGVTDLAEQLYPHGRAPRDHDPERAGSPIDLRSLLRTQAPSGADEATQRRTRFAHCALFAIEYALAQLWISWGLQPHALIGHSLGEYTAACLAGVMSLEDALMVVSERASLIESLDPGAMLAIAARPDELEAILAPGLSMAAVNSDLSCVVAGPDDRIDALAATLGQRGIAQRKVNASHAFHSTMMEPIRESLKRLLRNVELRAPRIPYVSNLTGTWIRAEQATDPAYWADHTCQTVRFGAGIETLFAEGVRTFVECGPGQALGSFALQQLASEDNAAPAVVPSIPGRAESAADDFTMARSLASLWCIGVAPEDALRRRERNLDGARGGDSMASVRAAEAPELARAPGIHAPAASMGLAQRSPGYAAPEGDVEPLLAAIWSEVLGAAKVGRNDAFFRLGGNSLMAIRVASRIHQRLGVVVPIRILFQYPTLSALAAWVEDALLSEIEALGEDADAGGSAECGEPEPTLQRLPNGLEVLQFNPAETNHFYHDIFEAHVYARNGIVLSDGAVVFDVGANIGLFSLYVRQQTKGAKIFAFEPAPPVYDLLRHNLREARDDTWLFNVGIADKPGRLDLTFYPRSTGMSSFHADGEEEREVLGAIMQNQLRDGVSGMLEVLEAVDEILDVRFKSREFVCEVRTLSEIIREHGVEQIDLIKIDVQKSEHSVLAGIDEEHWPRIRQMVVEVHDLEGRVAEVSRLLEARGFGVQVQQDELYKGSNVSNLYAIRR